MPARPAARLHARPALVGAALVGLGVALEAAWGIGAGLWFGLLVLAAGLVLTSAVLGRRRIVTLRPLAAALGALLAAVALGGGRMAAWRTLPPDHVAHVAVASEAAEAGGEDPTLVVHGRLVTPPVEVTSGLRFRLAADSAARGERVHPLRGRVEVTLARPRDPREPVPVYPALEGGDRVRIEGVLEPLPSRRNPADFDYGAYLRRQGVGALLRVSDEAAVQFLAPAGGVLGVVNAVRAHVRRAVGRFVRGEEARAVLLALLLADRSRIDPETNASFVDTGLAHLLAVSGLHVLLVGLVLYALLRPLLVRFGLGWRTVEVTRAGVTLLVLLLYAAVTGGAPSVVRAVVMAAVVIAGRVSQRPTDALNALGVAALLLVLWRPPVLFDVGFQLSFAAVGALVLLVPPLTAWVPERWTTRAPVRWTVGMLATSLAATLGTAPFLLYHFGRLPLAGLVLNAVAIPASQVALGAGLGVALTAGWWPWAADAFAAVAELGAWGMVAISRGGADWLDWTLVEGYVTTPAWLLTMALALLVPVVWAAPRVRWRATAGALGCAMVGVWGGVLTGEAAPRLDAVFLDVRQGDAALLTLPGGRHVLVDAGPRDSTWDSGARTVVPHLQRFNVRRIDAVVLTHPHADHVGGLEAVLRAVPVGRVVTNGQPSTLAWMARARRAADSLGVPFQTVRAGDTLDLGPAVRFRVLSPAAPPPATADSDAINDGSVVLRVEFGETALLLTGDAEAPAEQALVARYGTALSAAVVKVGHHGSRTSSTAAFVLAAARDSTWAVVPVARRNRYGLPDEEPLGRWAAAGARVVLTGREGAIWLRSDGRSVSRIDWRRE